MVECGLVFWIWMGDLVLVDEFVIVVLLWMQDSVWVGVKGYYDLKFSYVYLYENLFDILYLSYMYVNIIGLLDYVKVFMIFEIGEGWFVLVCIVLLIKLLLVWVKFIGLEGVLIVLCIVCNEFFSFVFYEVIMCLYDLVLLEGEWLEFFIKVVYMVSLVMYNIIYYFIYFGCDFVQDDVVVM